MIELDGSLGEGGGQILRTSLALALITNQSFRLRHIRARRSKPGLQAQHLTSVYAAATIGQAKVRGASVGSSDLVFEPGAMIPGSYHFRIGTAGACSLVLHTVYLPLALAAGSSTVTIEGGTHVKASPSFHFLDATWRGYMSLLGIDANLRLHRPGFYPRGGGLIETKLTGNSRPRELQLASVDCPRDVTVVAAVAGLPDSIARRMAERACQLLRRANLKPAVYYETWPGGPGTVLNLLLPTQPVPTLFSGLGERGKPAERVAEDAVHEALAFITAQPPGIDPHSADQLLLPLALAAGESHFPVTAITQHLLTNAAVIQKFVGRSIVCEGKEGEEGNVIIKG